jgi:hypothetical protein
VISPLVSIEHVAELAEVNVPDTGPLNVKLWETGGRGPDWVVGLDEQAAIRPHAKADAILIRVIARARYRYSVLPCPGIPR